jgi:hypothetical protein
MNLPIGKRLGSLLALFGIALLAATGCGNFFHIDESERLLLDDLVDERGVVRGVHLYKATSDSIVVGTFILDRVRYLEAGDPYNVNRVAQINVTKLLPRPNLLIDSLQLKVGDTVVVSGTFSGAADAYQQNGRGGLGDIVPQWPGHKRSAYGIGSYNLRKIERVSR